MRRGKTEKHTSPSKQRERISDNETNKQKGNSRTESPRQWKEKNRPGSASRVPPSPRLCSDGQDRPRGDATGAVSLFLEGTVCPESLALLPVICLNSRRRWKDWAISYSLQLPDSGQVASVTTKNTSPQPCVSGRRTLSQVGPPGSSFEGSAHRAPPSRP